MDMDKLDTELFTNPLLSGDLFQTARDIAIQHAPPGLLSAADSYKKASGAERVAAGELSLAQLDVQDAKVRLQDAENKLQEAQARFSKAEELADEASQVLLRIAERS